MAEIAGRLALINALSLYASRDRQAIATTFLGALSEDELRFLAQFLGSCILISSAINIDTWDAVSRRVAACPSGDDADHKLILVSEFAACCGFLIKFR